MRHCICFTENVFLLDNSVKIGFLPVSKFSFSYNLAVYKGNERAIKRVKTGEIKRRDFR
jgi:hypothetical protein